MTVLGAVPSMASTDAAETVRCRFEVSLKDVNILLPGRAAAMSIGFGGTTGVGATIGVGAWMFVGCGVTMFFTEVATACMVLWEFARGLLGVLGAAGVFTSVSLGGEDLDRKNPKKPFLPFSFEGVMDGATDGANELCRDMEGAKDDGVRSCSGSIGDEEMRKFSNVCLGAGVDGCPATGTRCCVAP